VRHLLHGNLGVGPREDAPVHPSEASGAEQAAVLEAAGGRVQVLEREPVWSELYLPIFAQLGVPEPLPEEEERDGERREDGHCGGHRQRDGQRLGPGLWADARQLRQLGVVERRSGAAEAEAPAEHVVLDQHDAGRRREADVRRVRDDRREVDLRGQERPLRPAGSRRRRHGDRDLRGRGVVVHPHLHGLPAYEAQVPERARGGVVVARRRGRGGVEAVDVDADVVVVNVRELRVAHGVELHGEDAVSRVAVVGAVEHAQVLVRHRRGQVRGRRDQEREPARAQVQKLRDDREHERGREGGHRARRRPSKRDGLRVEGVALGHARVVCELQQPGRRDGRHAVEVQAGGAAEAVVREFHGAAGLDAHSDDHDYHHHQLPSLGRHGRAALHRTLVTSVSWSW